MAAMRVLVLLPLLLLALCGAAGGVSSCPDPEDILPCVCTADEDGQMDIDCTDVESEEQLEQVFSAYLPSPNFRQLFLFQNKKLKALRRGALGEATFQNFFLHNGVLEEIEGGALNRSYATVTIMDFQLNRLGLFPFEELPLFEVLETLLLNTNPLGALPSLQSLSLREIYLGATKLGEIPVDGFRGVPNMSLISVSYNNLEEIIPGTFSGYPELQAIDLTGNLLRTLPAGAIDLAGDGKKEVDLSYNNISSIAVGSITGLMDGVLRLYENSITILDEESLRPLLEEGARITLFANPLGCGCDIVWLITSESFMNQTSAGPPTCADETPLADLDPAIYEDIC